MELGKRGGFLSGIRVDTWISAAAVAVSLGFYYEARDYPPAAAAYPRGLLIMIAALGVITLIQSLTKPKQSPDSRPLGKRPYTWALVVYLMTALYAAALEPLGFFIPTTLFAAGMMAYFGERRWWLMLLLAFIFNAFIYVSFVYLLKVPLPMAPAFMR